MPRMEASLASLLLGKNRAGEFWGVGAGGGCGGVGAAAVAG